MAITRIGKHLAYFGDMIISSRFEGDIDHGVAKVYSIVGAVVSRLHDVGSGISDDARERMERAGTVGEVNAQAGAAAVFHQAALDNPGKQADVDVASANQDGGALAIQRSLVLEQGCESYCARALGQRFFAFQEDKNCVRDFLFVDGYEFVHITLY